MTRVGRSTLATTLAIESVLPEPVTPRSTMWRRPSRTKLVSAAIACGWSPLGEYSEDNRNTCRATSGERWDGEKVLAPRVEERVRVWVSQHVRREHELRMHRLADEAHPDLVGHAIAFPQIATQTGRDHVHPGRLASARAGHDVVDGQPLAAAVAVLAGVAVPSQDVLLVEGHAVEERLADVHGQPDHGG